jgi:hypothetical protein
VLIVGAGVAYMVMPKGPPRTVAPIGGQTPTTPTGPIAQTPPAASAEQAVAAALPGLSCSWLDVAGPVQNGQPVKLSGASGSPATAQDAVMAAARGAGVSLPPAGGVDLSAVAQADQGACSALDAFRAFKAPQGAGPSLASAQPTYQITRDADGKLTGQPTITLAPHNPAQDFALLRLDTNGRVSMVYPSRKAFDAARQNDTDITDQGGDAYSVQADALNAAGTAGLLLLTGAGPFDPSLLAKPPSARDVSWIDQVRQAGTAGGWKSAMVWYKVQNNAPPVRPKARTGGYYAHPGVSEPPPEIVPAQPPPTSTTPPKRPSVWQRMFGSSASHGGESH